MVCLIFAVFDNDQGCVSFFIGTLMKKGSKRLLTLLMLAAAPLVWAEPISTFQDAPTRIERNPFFYGIASWYSEKDAFMNKYTANGEVFEDSKLTCASWDFEFGTWLEVKNLNNGKSIVCRVNDRGPSKRLHRVIDLTKTAFRKIADPQKGLVWVSVTPQPFPEESPSFD